MATVDRNLIAHLVRAMRFLSAALAETGFFEIHISTHHSLGILSASEPPSFGCFRRDYDCTIFASMLDFYHGAKTPFVVNTYAHRENGFVVEQVLDPSILLNRSSFLICLKLMEIELWLSVCGLEIV
uniref:Glucan endo-1,3-beta-glucosidase 14 n=1 Tax=Elaeis guineensis var. tenera TaxID=51953 RepID=A0A6I9R9Z7_ELAGV|nr:glucan endo-1,3-beta-glucosidase 14 [Elaeis guineensis]